MLVWGGQRMPECYPNPQGVAQAYVMSLLTPPHQPGTWDCKLGLQSQRDRIGCFFHFPAVKDVTVVTDVDGCHQKGV